MNQIMYLYYFKSIIVTFLSGFQYFSFNVIIECVLQQAVINYIFEILIE